LLEKANELQTLRHLKTEVVLGLQRALKTQIEFKVPPRGGAKTAPKQVAPEPQEKSPKQPEPKAEEPKKAAPPKAPPKPEPKAEPKKAAAEGIEIPPIKKDIAAHFNKVDESGRLFNVFKQYYACLNDTCGGTVRVTMKDGFCSLWNYDEWEEFAFVDMFEGQLRVSIDPRYKDALGSFEFCDVPRLLSSRRKLICVKVDDLNNTMLEVLVKAFEEVGMTAS